VLLEEGGDVSAVVVGGANTAWDEGEDYGALLDGVGVVLLQREVREGISPSLTHGSLFFQPGALPWGGHLRPTHRCGLKLRVFLLLWSFRPLTDCVSRQVPEHVNLAVAVAAAAANIPVVQDMGGADRPVSDVLLRAVAFVCPNESELQRLTRLPTSTLAHAEAAARSLQARGARAVLVTLGARGSMLLQADGTVLHQPPLPVPGGKVEDTTGAGGA
jgi:hypothetical protein